MAKKYKKGILLVLIIGVLAVAIIDTQGQFLLDPSTQQKFGNPLPIPSVIEPTTPNGTHYEISMTQFTQDLSLKDNFGNPMLTRWGYNGRYPSPSFEARRNIPITVKWKNELMDGNDALPHLLPVDTSIHWAMPENCPYSGVPLVKHLHEGHTESASDGNPYTWFTPNYTQKGSYWSQKLYHYSSDHEASTLWHHDNALVDARSVLKQTVSLKSV